MAYLGSEAYRLDYIERGLEERDARPSFDVIEGGGADARVRRGVSTAIVARIKVVAAAVVAFVLVGVVRVTVTARTVGELTENVALERQIAEAESTNSDLRIGRSILSSSARIERIAVENYGMAYATERDVIVLGDDGVPAAEEPSAQDEADLAGEVGAPTDDAGAPEADAAS